MIISRIENPAPVDYQSAFPNVSFPQSGPSDEFLSDNGYAKVRFFKEHDSKTQKLVSSTPYYEEPWVYTVKVVDKTQEDIDREIQAQWANIRATRDAKLKESDWTQLPDVPLTEEKKVEWVTYRQALRDVTNQPDPFEIVWPTQPE